MGINIDGARDLLTATDGSLTIEGQSINSTGVGTFSGGFKVGTAATIHSTGQLNIGVAATIFANGNATFAGILTAASYVGDGSGLTGVASTDNIQTGTPATFLSNVNITGVTTATGGLNVGTAATIAANGNATFSGIVTATSFVGSGANLTGISAVGGATGVDFNDDVLVRLGTGNDLTLKHTGSYSMIHDNSADLYIQGDEIHLRSNTNNDQYLKATVDSAVELYHNNVKVVQTASQGIDFATDGHGITFSAQTAASGTGVSGTDIGQRFQDYEMGDWTPTDGSGTALTSDTGRYFKHGHLVYAAADCTFGTRSGGGTLTVDGLPYTIGSNAIGGGYLKYSTITSGQFTTYPLIHINPGTTALHFPGTTLSDTSAKRLDFVVIYVVYNF